MRVPKLLVAAACQVAAGFILMAAHARGDAPECTSSNLEEIWCSECVQIGPQPLYLATKYQCTEQGWQPIGAYSGPDEQECESFAEECSY